MKKSNVFVVTFDHFSASWTVEYSGYNIKIYYKYFMTVLWFSASVSHDPLEIIYWYYSLRKIKKQHLLFF